ncbi:DEAD/DEAH box helicase family protein [Clostridium perfringens]|uniref:DEAD/DEAH box helicase family protein n=1 Tax=Clostridium perfringens TaxID=1502 RepID=UPI0032DB7B5C|nr:DEAD/DEAH box helicase family protein [Clostridium perfringens]
MSKHNTSITIDELKILIDELRGAKDKIESKIYLDEFMSKIDSLGTKKVIQKEPETKTLNELWNEKQYKIKQGINLVIAPCGSGKTYFTFNTLIKEEKLESIVYLCDTRNLKNAVLLDETYHPYCRFYSKDDINNIVNGKTTVFGESIGENKITVMTYAQFGMIAEKHSETFGNVKMIICDEAHQAIDYQRKFDKDDERIYRSAVIKINKISEKAKVVLLTATPDIIKFANITNIFDFSNEPNIKRLKENKVITYTSGKEIKRVITEFKKLTDQKKVKMLIYTDRIKTVNEIVKGCHDVGLKAIGLWSLNNKDNAMSTYQLETLNSVVSKGLIPDELDILVINASLQTGVNIKNNDIDWVLVNSINKVTQIQARSRVRKDIDKLYIKAEETEEFIEKKIILEDKWLNTPLTTVDKNKLCEELGFYDEKDRLLKWSRVSKILLANDYKIKDSTKQIKGKRSRISIISI